MQTNPDIFSYRKHWAHKFEPAPVLPMSREEMDMLGWDSCDIIIVTGDAYVDHPSFGMAIIGRLLESQGFRVGIISQPDWRSADAFRELGQPNLFFGITAGNMDSMVNHYTSDRKSRSDDAYTPDGAGGKRPDRAVTVYAQRAREAFKGTPVVIGGIEASLRRIAQYDYWSEKVRRSVLPDSKADMLLFGNAERAIVELAHRLAAGENIREIRDIRGTAYMQQGIAEGWTVIDSTEIDEPGSAHHRDPHPYTDTTAEADCKSENAGAAKVVHFYERPSKLDRNTTVIRLPSYDQVSHDKRLYAHASRVFHLETNPGNARAMVQRHGKRDVWLNPPPIPLTTSEMDQLFEFPYTRRPHPAYGDARNPAWEMIRFSVNIMRGCFGGCTFCSITEHEGRIIQSRSEDSIIREVETIRDTVPGFTGNISDLGGPTANMYRLKCKDEKIEASCRRLSCVYPDICKNLGTNHAPLTLLYRRARELPGIKRVFIASGLRYDIAVRDPEYIRELVTHHVGGYLKIAPEHTESGPLSKMMKPGIGTYDRFKQLFDKYSKAAGKEQYLIPYFISAHPGTSDEDMLNLAMWLKRNNFRPDQVQAFLPTPMAIASAMYHTGLNPLKKVTRRSEQVATVKGIKQRRLHKAFLRYHDPANWPLLRDALKQMGRADLIGNGKRHLVPSWQPGEKRAPKIHGQKKDLHHRIRTGKKSKRSGGRRVFNEKKK
ncbi:YgiQ family radical SAM protein [Solemya velum gill symbiont]|uniref:YgiQ family radical SAM protein n=1 Tax=Solemya velum gill symbiont TaxID=2340 RepID=UPI000996D381|nr:YgiQ family radical SAM protein [Solemya velum gill symbiont]OOZ45861.1 YgiQ family radical SAM protein [Solemya velum gill symbiont]OOZ57069.1 YgiQ family radical SAM protein [Solemya velum gill symbiont]OOZ62959.1 YgiQ family radical SAM protein [Solemya velum gill symbiont]OOZ65499.1 YgiQ family radical SAM protein [Solemya velum gill symbiont]OOZ68100.1 YgiQ family radical SAM protein [Solemya velum gill symbiont]